MNGIVSFFKRNTPLGFRIFIRSANWKINYFYQSIIGLHFKKKYFCPVSEKHYTTFIKKGLSTISPDLGARDRHRFLWHYLKNETQLFSSKQKKLLHIAPEYCFYKKFIDIKPIEYFPVDKFEPGYDYLSKTQNFDLLEVGSEQHNTFDYILCNHVLEHIVDDKKAIENIFFLLKPGGTAIVTIPILENGKSTYEDFSITSPRERKTHFGQWDHVRYYGLDVENRFANAGFSVKVISSNDYLSPQQRELYGIHGESHIFHLEK